MIENIDKLIAVLRKNNGKTLLPGNLIARLAQKTSLSNVEIRACMLELREREWVRSDDWDERGIPLAKLTVALPPEPPKSYEIRWQEALSLADLEEKDRMILSPVARSVSEMSMGEMLFLVKGLEKLRHDLPTLFGERLFDVSSRYLLGSSKLLKNIPSKILSEFGISVDVLSGPPRYVKIAGAHHPRATVLVENPHAFEAAVLADVNNDFCWISAEGYGLSKQGEEFGDQLTSMVINRKGVITLSRREIFVDFQSALDQGRDRLFFWGDLDLAGLDIYGRLKTYLPTIKLSPLYQPMVEMLKNGEGHSYVGVQKERQTLGDFPYIEISELAPLCVKRGLDQETIALTASLIFSLHGFTFP